MAKIGKVSIPTSDICMHNADQIIVRGMDLSEQVIGNMGFTAYFHFLVTGRKADAATCAILDATLVAIAEHGMVPSVQAARMTLAAAPDAMQGAVAAGLLGCGSVILGASYSAGVMLKAIERYAAEQGASDEAAALAIVGEMRSRKEPIAGYGHPEHKARDPRVDALFAVAESVGGDLRYVALAKAVESIIPQVLGKELKLNVSGAIPAVLLGVDFPLAAMKGVPLLARTASLIAHMTEEAERPVGFALAYQATSEFEYTGPAPQSELASVGEIAS